MIDPFKKGKPDFVNDEGFSWWQQPMSLNAEKNEALKKLGYRWYYVEKDSTRKHVILKDNDIVREETTLEAVAFFFEFVSLFEGKDFEKDFE